MPVTSRAGKTYDLSAVTAHTERRRRKAGMSTDELATVQREEATRSRAQRVTNVKLLNAVSTL